MGQKLVEHAGAVIPAPVLEYVTPDMARGWLAAHNGQNRSVRTRWVASLADEIVSGRWMVTGDPIRFDETGNLIDGQHRLAAVVRSNMAIPLFVICGLPVAVRDVIDTGVARLASDTMKFAGFKNTANIAAVAKIGVMRELGYLRSALRRLLHRIRGSTLSAHSMSKSQSEIDWTDEVIAGCSTCGEGWPCRTIRALDGEEPN